MTPLRSLKSRTAKDASRLRGRSRESGFAYIMALFMIVAVIIASQVALQNLATEGRRLREQETIWRGEQCVQAIRLYYHKTGHYPQTFEDLQKGLPELHFLRAAAYNDPMNKDDGSWRMIYVNASGQIIGSVRYATLQQMALMDLNGGQMPAQGTIPGAVPVSAMASSGGQPGQTPQGSQPPQQPTTPGPTPQDSQQSGQPAATGQSTPGSQQPGQPAAPGQTPNPLDQLKPTGPVDGPVLGGFLTGVASKMERPSVRFYKGGKKYIEWEFIWNPLEDQARAAQQGLTPQGAQPGQPGQPITPGGIGPGAPGTTLGFGFGGTIPPPTSTPAPQQ